MNKMKIDKKIYSSFRIPKVWQKLEGFFQHKLLSSKECRRYHHAMTQENAKNNSWQWGKGNILNSNLKKKGKFS